MRKLALPVSGGRIAPQLEEARTFLICQVEGQRVIGTLPMEIGENLVSRLRSLEVEALLCGMLSPTLRRDLAMAGIVVFAGVYGAAEETAQQLLDGTLSCEPDTLRASHAAHYSPCSHSGEY